MERMRLNERERGYWAWNYGKESLKGNSSEAKLASETVLLHLPLPPFDLKAKVHQCTLHSRS